MNKQLVLKLVKILGTVLILGFGAYLGVDTQGFLDALQKAAVTLAVPAETVPTGAAGMPGAGGQPPSVPVVTDAGL